jgi:hypothetical protein
MNSSAPVELLGKIAGDPQACIVGPINVEMNHYSGKSYVHSVSSNPLPNSPHLCSIRHFAASSLIKIKSCARPLG